MEAIVAESAPSIEPSPSEAMLLIKFKSAKILLNVVIKDMIRELEAVLVLLGGNVTRA